MSRPEGLYINPLWSAQQFPSDDNENTFYFLVRQTVTRRHARFNALISFLWARSSVPFY